MAPGSSLCFSIDPTSSQVIAQNKEPQSTGVIGGTILAETPMVSTLRSLAMELPLTLPVPREMLIQGPVLHPKPAWYRLTAWQLSGADYVV